MTLRHVIIQTPWNTKPYIKIFAGVEYNTGNPVLVVFVFHKMLKMIHRKISIIS